MKTVRQRILEFIQSHRAVSAAEISLAFRMTKANSRYHLTQLHEQGLIAVVDYRKRPGKGRPERVYSLSNQVLGDNLHTLAEALLQLVFLIPGDKPSSDFMKEIARNMAMSMEKPAGKSTESGAISSKLYSQVKSIDPDFEPVSLLFPLGGAY